MDIQSNAQRPGKLFDVGQLARQSLPPNMGREVVPHTVTFAGVLAGAANVYRPSDEALQHSRENARFMENDVSLMECVEMRQRSTALLGWHIEAEDQKDPRQKQLTEDIKNILDRIPRFMQYRECLAKAIWFGRYANEQRYGWDFDAQNRRRCIVNYWRPVHGDKLTWKFDRQRGEVDPEGLCIRVGVGTIGMTEAGRWWGAEHGKRVEPSDFGSVIPVTKNERPLIAVHKHLIEDGAYEDPRSAGRIHGVGIRHRIYWTWYQKQECLAFLMEFLERCAGGIEIWYYPMGNPQAEEKARKAATDRIGQSRNIVLVPKPLGPDGAFFGVDRIEANMGGAEALRSILQDYFGAQIKRYILGQTLTTEAAATGLGSNLASIHLDTYLQIIRYDSVNLGETITGELVEPLKDFNWPELRNAHVRFVIETETPDVQQKLKAWKDAFDMNARIRERDVLELIGAAEPGPEDHVLQRQQGGGLDFGALLAGAGQPQ